MRRYIWISSRYILRFVRYKMVMVCGGGGGLVSSGDEMRNRKEVGNFTAYKAHIYTLIHLEKLHVGKS